MVRLLALGLLAALLAGAARAQTPTFQGPALQAPPIADIASYAGPDRAQRLIAGAKKEGALTLYSSGPIEDTTAITYAFEKKYGLPVRLWRGSSEDILRRAMSEARGTRPDVDVAETAGPGKEALRREKLMPAITAPEFPALIPQSVAPRP